MGFEVVTLGELGLASRALADHLVLERAAADDRAVLTLNRKDFVRLHGTSPNHAGIIVCSLDLDFDGQAERIRAAVATRTSLVRELLRVHRSTSRGAAPR